MTESYKVRSTSRSSARVEERELSRSGTTRKVVEANLHDNPNDAEAAVKITIFHQRKGNKKPWEEVESTPLSKLKADEVAKMSLSSSETLALRRELENLYAIYERNGIQWGDRELVVADAREIIRTDQRRATVIRALLDQGHSDEVWATLIETDPDLATRLSYARLQEDRERVLARFRGLVGRDESEATWQEFLDANTWIFGYGLDYRVLRPAQRQPDYGGRGVSGRGGQRGDNLRATDGDVRFTVLVEVKKPSTELLVKHPYRNRVHSPSPELAGGISQLQSNCQTWEVEGSRTDANRDELDDILTVKPKGILVIGRGNQLDTRDKQVSFELLRRNTLNPNVVTFDELLARAEYIVHGRSQRPSSTTDEPRPSDEKDDEIPF